MTIASVAFTPQASLQTDYVNPAPPPATNWAADLVKQNRSDFAILPSLLQLAVWIKKGDQFPVCAREWVQVLDPAEDYDLTAVGCTGWVLQPELAGTDVPFNHPFRSDWECMVALDPEFTGLLARGNVIPDGKDGLMAMTDANRLGIPVPPGGLLAVEQDQNCVPSAFKDPVSGAVQVGDRIAVFGRWIVDAGHSVTDPTGAEDSYRAEVHPPLLMAIGGDRLDAAGNQLTRIAVTSRPYLSKQVFTTDKDSIYDDSGSVDGTMLEHLNNEVDKLTSGIFIPDSTTLEAHPKIAAKPFSGSHFYRLIVRPPDSTGGGGIGGHGGISGIGLGDAEAEQVEVSFQFTCRTGIGVEVIPQTDHVELLISLNSVPYTAPPLPPRQTEVWDKDRLNDESAGAGDVITLEQLSSLLTLNPLKVTTAELALAHGIETDRYEVPDVDVFNRSQAVPFTAVDQLPGGTAGIITDDGQPYPVTGFLEIRRRRPDQNLGVGDVAGSESGGPIRKGPTQKGAMPS
ncbi:hypothetical protein M6D93_15125 [Jatrophihabitans telluris]|uniref:Uncharacterized protein n=1 Tax=Jatrophihabitans telluris TaxID=2038343 RepID=A0ABY4QVZ4_9ACTN|nr:hypothetical protein [Jatrophihabitans telluris]UQX87623.1 hypothetical protein M6D93_15125 [Jatrophihabitans telluris]